MKTHIWCDANTQGRDFVVGDIHGMYDLLIQQLSNLNFDNDKDRLFSVGDLIDRGPDSAKCLKLFADRPNFFAVVGNHELMMHDSVVDGWDQLLWLRNGGDWSTNHTTEELMSLTKIIDEMPFSITVRRRDGSTVGICHAQPIEDWSLLQNDMVKPTLLDSIVWNRNWIQFASEKSDGTPLVKGVDMVFCGHTPSKRPVQISNVRWIDTGACFISANGFLTIEQIA